MSSILLYLLVFTYAWKKGSKQTVLIALQNTGFCLQVGFFFPSAMCIVYFHFWIGSLTFVPVLKESGTNNTQTRVFGNSTINSFIISLKTQSAAILLQGKTNWCLIKERDFIVPLNQNLNFVFTPWEIYFARQKTSNISDNFLMALRGKMLTRFHWNPFLLFSDFLVQFTWSATTTITTPEHVSVIRCYVLLIFWLKEKNNP